MLRRGELYIRSLLEVSNNDLLLRSCTVSNQREPAIVGNCRQQFPTKLISNCKVIEST